MPEIEEIISDVAETKSPITFVPHLLPVMRGILASLYLEKKNTVSDADIYNAFKEEYADEPFIRLKPR